MRFCLKLHYHWGSCYSSSQQKNCAISKIALIQAMLYVYIGICIVSVKKDFCHFIFKIKRDMHCVKYATSENNNVLWMVNGNTISVSTLFCVCKKWPLDQFNSKNEVIFWYKRWLHPLLKSHFFEKRPVKINAIWSQNLYTTIAIII